MGIEPELLRLVAELWERPAEYLSRLADGSSLDLELVRLEEEEAAARLGRTSRRPRSSPFEMRRVRGPPRPRHRGLDGVPPPGAVRAVNLSADAPVRVRGGAGTGKTVVALHRARRLAEESNDRVLLTTFVSTLPKVWGGLFETFAPEAARAST